MASDDIMTAGAGGATATVRADIKAAFFDIDGTLTSFVTHVIPQSSIDALHELQDRGVKVFICSGRAPSHMTVVLDMMPVHFDGIIALNGQYCFDDHGLLEKESLLPEDIVTITRWLDEHNDADMLAFAGIGVAMGNATEPAKAAADYITDDVDHDGIMNALKHFNVL